MMHLIYHVYQIDQVLLITFFSFLFIIIYQDNRSKCIFNGVEPSPESSITILSGSLQSNQTYQFLVIMENRRNAILQATGYVLVQIVDSHRPMIAIGYKYL
jgi:hypothetical protein